MFAVGSFIHTFCPKTMVWGEDFLVEFNEENQEFL